MKKIIAILLTLLFLFPTTCYAANSIDEKSVKAKSVCLMCLDTGDVLYSNNEYEHLSPASVTKIMSLLLVLEALESKQIKLTDKVSATEDAVSMGGSQIWLEVGEEMTVEELLKAVIVASANDACTALGNYIAGSPTGFVKMMNDKAKELGLKNSHFENCTGLDDTVTNHYSCAYDLAVISREVMKHEIVTKYSTIWLDSLRNGETELNNTNKLINKYNGITGLKTGTTSKAGFCISATAKRDNMNLVAVVLGSDTSEDRFRTASYLLDWGFANYQVIEPKIDTKKITPVKVNGGVFKEVMPKINDDAKILTEKNVDNITYKYNIKASVNAPIKKGEELGTITVLSNKKRIYTLNLVSPNTISKISFSDIWQNILINI